MLSLRAAPVFSAVVLVSLALLGWIAVMLFGGLLGLNPAIAAMGHFSSLSHRVHDLTYSFLFGVAAVGMLCQLGTPSKNVAGQLMAVIPWLSFVLAYALGNILPDLLRPPFVPIFGALTVLATVLHPSGAGLFSSFSVSRVSWLMLVLAIIAAVPLLAFASTNIGLQRAATDDHAAMGHYGYMAAFSFTVIGVGLLASLRPDGYRLSTWVAGLLPAFHGIASVVVPDVSSSLSPAGGFAAIAWGAVFVAAAELTRRTGPVVETGEDAQARSRWAPVPGTTLWLSVFGIIALVVVLLAVVILFTGVGGTGGHTPPIRHGP